MATVKEMFPKFMFEQKLKTFEHIQGLKSTKWFCSNTQNGGHILAMVQALLPTVITVYNEIIYNEITYETVKKADLYLLQKNKGFNVVYAYTKFGTE